MIRQFQQIAVRYVALDPEEDMLYTGAQAQKRGEGLLGK
jgi:hypothetical protein